MTAQTDEPTSPGVNFPPPLLFIVSGGCGVTIESMFPLPLSSLVTMSAQVILAWSAIAAGTGLLCWALLVFKVQRTAIYPNQPARQLVARGPYRISRNPMYVALVSITVGVGLLADNLWMLLLLPLVLSVLTRFVIQREERYLAAEFGESYVAYKNRVRRWL